MMLSLVHSLIYDLFEEREEILLAILAAGVSADRIELTGPHHHFTLELDLKFTE